MTLGTRFEMFTAVNMSALFWVLNPTGITDRRQGFSGTSESAGRHSTEEQLRRIHVEAGTGLKKSRQPGYHGDNIFMIAPRILCVLGL
jgi:hypothetical protein